MDSETKKLEVKEVKSKEKSQENLEDRVQYIRDKLIKLLTSGDLETAQHVVAEVEDGEYGFDISLQDISLWGANHSVIDEVLHLDDGKYKEIANDFGAKCELAGYIDSFSYEY